MDFPAHPFWDFALDVYRRPGVSDACLQLQERHHLDVNLLLFVSWIGASGRGRLTPHDIGICIDTVGPWHDAVVRPLRGVRRMLKGDLGATPAGLTQALRREIQGREIDAEHIEQLMLAAVMPREPQAGVPQAARLADAGHNARSYLMKLDAGIGAPEGASLVVILHAAFPDMAAAEVRATLDSVSS